VEYDLFRRGVAEFVGAFTLIFIGGGAGIVTGQDIVAVALANGLAIGIMVSNLGHISGGHFNPAITVGLAMGRRFDWKEVPAYVVTQVAAAVVAACGLWVIAHGVSGFDSTTTGFASNGYGDHSPAGYAWWAVLLTEVVLTAFFLYVILGVTDVRAPKGFAPIAIGLVLTLIHLISIPIDNTSVNPARSIGPALFAGGTAIGQLWLFIIAAPIGALIAGATYELLFGSGEEAAPLEVATEG
jgi:aquaporin Z